MATRIGRSLTPLNISGKDGLSSSRVEKCSCHIACSCAQQSTWLGHDGATQNLHRGFKTLLYPLAWNFLADKTAFLGGPGRSLPKYFSKRSMLRELHWEHPVICAVKVIPRTCVWWLKMDEEIEIKSCSICQNVRNYPPSAPFILWKWATRPFRRIHVDFYQRGCDYFLVVLHSHSKWIEVQHLTVITTEKTINELSEEVVSAR